jgi:hypothetical protein
MKRLMMGGGLIGLLAMSWFVAPGLATLLGTGSQTLTAGNASITACDPDGVTTLFVLSGTSVASVTVSGISSACGNAAINVAVNNGTTSSSGTASVPVGGGSVSVTLSSSVPLNDAMQTEIAVS